MINAKFMRKFMRKFYNLLIISIKSGDGRTRTAVQTPHRAAFYTLSPALVFDRRLPSDGLPEAYPLKLNGI